MYCVKCGVRLSEGVSLCPLCQTPVWNPEGAATAEPPFSDRYPTPPKSRRYPVLAFLTALLMAGALSCLIACLTVLGEVGWSGYVMLGCALLYFATIFPFWFDRREPLIFVPWAFALLEGYLLYICLRTGGHWFLSFAFPVVLLVAFFVTASIALFRLLKRRRLLITGSLLVAIGCATMLVEFFQCITFQTTMFTWSLYCVTAFSFIGCFLILCGLIPPWREFLERKLFF